MSELINKLNQYRSMGDKFYPEDIVVIEDIWALIDEIERLNNIIKQQNTRNSRQRIANRKLLERNQDLVIENLKLNNIINELEKYITETKLEEFEKEYGRRYAKTFTQAEVIICNMILNKLHELKGSDKE